MRFSTGSHVPWRWKTFLVLLVILVALCPSCSGSGGGEGATALEVADSTFLVFLLTNRFVYDLTHEAGTAPPVEVVISWVKAISVQLGVSVKYSERIGQMMINRVKHLRKKLKEMKGGAPRQKFLQLEWEFKVLPKELEGTELRHELTRADDRLSEEKEKSAELQDELTKLRAEKECSDRKLHKAMRQLEATAKSGTTHTSGRGRSLNRSFDDYSVSHRRRLKRARTNSCGDLLSWLEGEGLVPIRIEVRNTSTGKNEMIELKTSEAEDLLGPGEVTGEDLDVVNMILYIKDRYNVSNSAYHEMAKVCRELPRHYKLKSRIRELNLRWSIRPTPEGSTGVQQPLEDRLKVRVRHLLSTSNSDAAFRKNKCLHVKLSGDGTKIGKRLHVVNFTFTLLDEVETVCSYEGSHTLAIFKEPEKYEKLKVALADIRNDVERLSSVEVDGVTYTITYYIGADWKFLAIITGIDSASCDYACIWCKCTKNERSDFEKEWSITEPCSGARSIAENAKLSELPQSKKKFNVSHRPLFPSIPLSNVVIDNLHLFLRVSDVLIDLLILELKRQDAIEKVKKFTVFEPRKFKHCDAYQTFVASLGVPGYEFYVGETSKQLKIRSLTGPEKLKVCAHIQIAELLPAFPAEETSRIQHLWTELLHLNQVMSKRASELSAQSIEEYKTRARQWGRDFINVYQSKNVTPYIHAMINHVGEFMNIHGSILPFTQQRLEKQNDILTKNFFRSSCHRGEVALRQLIEKQNRLEHLVDCGSAQKKCYEVSCSNCEAKGHNRLSCCKPCRECAASVYRDHLVIVNGKRVPRCEQEN